MDAGADLTLEYPYPDPDASFNGWLDPETALTVEQLPDSSWPAPDPEASCGSPFSQSPRDYLRVAGPGVYVGCAYRPRGGGEAAGREEGGSAEGRRPEYNEEDCVYFCLVRKVSRREYKLAMERERLEGGGQGGGAAGVGRVPKK